MKPQSQPPQKSEIKHPDRPNATGPYSAGLVIDGWLYVSGQGPLDLRTGKVVEGNIEAQTRLTLNHIGDILKAAGSTFADVVKCNCYLRDMGDFDRFNSVYTEFFVGIRPARTTVQATLWNGIKVEVDAIAKMRT